MQVKDLMASEVVTIGREASLRDAVEQLLEYEVGSVIVLSEQENPIGIITENDVLRAVYKTGNRLEDIGVMDLAHRPLVTIAPSATIQLVAKKMADNDVKKVPVMDDLELVGMITLTDIVWHLSDIRSEAGELAMNPEDMGLE